MPNTQTAKTGEACSGSRATRNCRNSLTGSDLHAPLLIRLLMTPSTRSLFAVPTRAWLAATLALPLAVAARPAFADDAPAVAPSKVTAPAQDDPGTDPAESQAAEPAGAPNRFMPGRPNIPHQATAWWPPHVAASPRRQSEPPAGPGCANPRRPTSPAATSGSQQGGLGDHRTEQEEGQRQGQGQEGRSSAGREARHRPERVSGRAAASSSTSTRSRSRSW